VKVGKWISYPWNYSKYMEFNVEIRFLKKMQYSLTPCNKQPIDPNSKYLKQIGVQLGVQLG